MIRRSKSDRHKRRWLVLVLSAVVTLGSYYCYDNPSALHDQLAAYFAATPYGPHFEIYFNLLYTVYSIPNCVLPLLGGVLSDRFGNRLMLVVFSVLIGVGQLVCLVGVWNDSMLTMLLGRVVFGLGGESLSVSSSALISSWFAGKELALALGINLSFSRLGSVANDIWSPASFSRGYHQFGGGDDDEGSDDGEMTTPDNNNAVGVGLLFSFGAGFLMCLVSICSAVLLACLDDKPTQADGSNAAMIDYKCILVACRCGTSTTGGGAFEGDAGSGGIFFLDEGGATPMPIMLVPPPPRRNSWSSPLSHCWCCWCCWCWCWCLCLYCGAIFRGMMGDAPGNCCGPAA